jgi:hypothetical protein
MSAINVGLFPASVVDPAWDNIYDNSAELYLASKQLVIDSELQNADAESILAGYQTKITEMLDDTLKSQYYKNPFEYYKLPVTTEITKEVEFPFYTFEQGYKTSISGNVNIPVAFVGGYFRFDRIQGTGNITEVVIRVRDVSTGALTHTDTLFSATDNQGLVSKTLSTLVNSDTEITEHSRISVTIGTDDATSTFSISNNSYCYSLPVDNVYYN